MDLTTIMTFGNETISSGSCASLCPIPCLALIHRSYVVEQKSAKTCWHYLSVIARRRRRRRKDTMDFGPCMAVRVGGTVKNGSARGTQSKGHEGMPVGTPFCDVAYLMPGPRLHSQNHCRNDHIVIVL